MASKKKGISAGTTWAASSLASTCKYNGWSKEGYERYNTLYQRVKKDRQEQGAAFDLQVQLYDEEQGKASHGDDKNVEDYVIREHEYSKLRKKLDKFSSISTFLAEFSEIFTYLYSHVPIHTVQYGTAVLIRSRDTRTI